jgi:hypothetical protein
MVKRQNWIDAVLLQKQLQKAKIAVRGEAIFAAQLYQMHSR